MKTFIIATLMAGLAGAGIAADKDSLKTETDKLAYGIGVNIGNDLKKNDLEGLNADLVAQGIRDTIAGKAALTDPEVREVVMNFQTQMRAKREEKQKQAAGENKKKGDDFLAENKKKEGVKVKPITLPDGKTYELQYKVVTQGTGPVPTTNDSVTTHYRGTLIDDTEFDNSYKRADPSSFAVTQVIKGWTEALLMMPVGSKWQLFIPAELAYGERGRPGIPPNAALLFDIELLGIKGKEAGDAKK